MLKNIYASLTFAGAANSVADAFIVTTAVAGTVTLTLAAGGSMAIPVTVAAMLQPLRTLSAGANIVALKE